MKDWNLKLQFKISQANLEKMAWQTYPQENHTSCVPHSNCRGLV
jgi:hypothetical protein